AGVPRALLLVTVNVAKAARRATAAGAVPAKVSALTEGVLKGMLMRKLKLTTALLFAAAAALGLTAGAARQALARPDEQGKQAVRGREVKAPPKTEEAPRLPETPLPVPVLARMGPGGKILVRGRGEEVYVTPLPDKGGG